MKSKKKEESIIMEKKMKVFNTLKNKRGQGATEYILLLVIVVGLAIAFGPRIKNMVMGKLGQVEGQLQQVTGN